MIGLSKTFLVDFHEPTPISGILIIFENFYTVVTGGNDLF